jgi:hypothetical protein
VKVGDEPELVNDRGVGRPSVLKGDEKGVGQPSSVCGRGGGG